MVSVAALGQGLEKYLLLQNKPFSKTIKGNVPVFNPIEL